MGLLDTDDQVDRTLGDLVRRGIGKTKNDVVKKALNTLGGITTDENKKADWKQAIDAANKSNMGDTVKQMMEYEFMSELMESRRERAKSKGKGNEEDDDMGNGMMQMMMMMMNQQAQAADRAMQMQMQQQRDAMLQRLAATPSSDKDSKAEILEYIKMADERTEKMLAAGREETSKQQQLQIANKHHDDLMMQFQAMNDASNKRIESMMSQHAGDMEHLDERLRRLQDPKTKAAPGEEDEQLLNDIPLSKARLVRKKLEEAGAMPLEQSVEDRLRLDREGRKGTQETQLLNKGVASLERLEGTVDHTFRQILAMTMQQQPNQLANAGISTAALQNARTEQERAAAYAQIQAQVTAAGLNLGQQPQQQPAAPVAASQQPAPTPPAPAPAPTMSTAIESVALQRPSAPSVPVPTAEAVPANGG